MVGLRVVLVAMESDLRNIFMIPHNYYFVQINVTTLIYIRIGNEPILVSKI